MELAALQAIELVEEPFVDVNVVRFHAHFEKTPDDAPDNLRGRPPRIDFRRGAGESSHVGRQHLVHDRLIDVPRTGY
jgi:hypothetical protein